MYNILILTIYFFPIIDYIFYDLIKNNYCTQNDGGWIQHILFGHLKI